MEFSEKLQALRKSRSMTQEQLAEALYVSRTAVSKWESGRGYPSIDSLREISRFFAVSIDELIAVDEVISAASDEKRAYVGRITALVCGALDALLALLMVIPAFGNGTGAAKTAALFALDGVNPWVKGAFILVIALTVLNGICGVAVARLDKPLWNRHRLATGAALSVLCVAVFIAARQPYAGLACFAFLVVKGLLLRRAS